MMKSQIQNEHFKVIELFRLDSTFKNIKGPTINQELPSPPLNFVAKCHIYMVILYLQWWWVVVSGWVQSRETECL